jgi:tetratricopeptide (TPR) repeat protein
MKPRHAVAILLSLFALVLASSTVAHAQKDPRADAKTHYAAGKKLFDAGQYEQAIAEFKAADGLAPSGVNDYNIALSYERLGKTTEAIQYYQSYLTRMPNADNRTDIEATIEVLQQQQAAEEAARKAQEEADAQAHKPPPPPDGGTTTTGIGNTGDPELDRVAAVDVDQIRNERQSQLPPPPSGGGTPAGAGGAAVPQPQGEQPKKSKPIYKQWWFWVVAGVSAYVLYEIVASGSSNDSQPGALQMPADLAPTPGAGFSLHF